MTEGSQNECASLEDKLGDAARQGDLDEMSRLLKMGANAAGCDSKGWPLTTDAFEDDVLKLLLENGAEIDARDRKGRTALHWAAFCDVETADLFLRHGADPNARDEDGETPLFLAERAQLQDVASLLMKHGADVNAKRFDGRTMFSGAISGNNVEFVSLLLDAGADIELRDDETGETPLITASSLIHTWGPAMSKLLVTRGANVHVQDSRFHLYTPLHYAAWFGDAELVTLLLKSGADPARKAADGATPLSLAMQLERTDVVAALLSRGIWPRVKR